MSNDKPTLEEAYRAAFYFLDVEFEQTKSDDLAGLLGDMNWHIWVGGRPADPAVWPQWLEAVELAQPSNTPAANEGKLTPEEAFRAMFYFLEIEYGMVKLEYIGAILNSMSPYIKKDGRPANSKIWPKWYKAMKYALSSDDRLSV